MSEDKNIEIAALYQDLILDHQSDPRNYGKIEGATVSAEGFNPVCGDRVRLDLKVDDQNKIVDQKFSGEGCSICMASASMMTEEIESHPVGEVYTLIQKFRDSMQDKTKESFTGDLEALMGVKRFPVRIKCALLPWTTLKQALDRLPSKENSKTESEHGT